MKCSCGAKMVISTVAIAKCDGLFPCSGGGECNYKRIWKCPRCQKEIK